MHRIGIASWCLPASGSDTLYQAAMLGLQIIHIDAGGYRGHPDMQNERVRQAYREASERTGIEITGIGINILNDYGLHSAAGTSNAQKCWSAIERALEAANALRVPLLFLPSFRQSEIRTEQELQRTAQVLRKACLQAAQANIIVATENSLGIEGNRQLIRFVNHPQLRILLDTFNPVRWGHNVGAMVVQLYPFLCQQIHLKDGWCQPLRSASLTLGEANVIATLQALKARNFQGDFLLENTYPGNLVEQVRYDRSVLHTVGFGKKHTPENLRGCL